MDEFDQGTLAKLRLFDWYLRDWIPVFYSLSGIRTINIVDFFCGPGEDRAGKSGSPLIIMNRVLEASERLNKWGGKVNLHFNDIKPRNTESLLSIIRSRHEFSSIPMPKITCDPFDKIFGPVVDTMNKKDTANLLFIDQYGVKSFTLDVFMKLTTLVHTDFLAFFATEHLRRFADQPVMHGYHPELARKLKSVAIDEVSGTLSSFLRSKLPRHTTFLVSDFTIKKGPNAYTLLFGSGHPLGVDKFVRQCWKVDPFSGKGYVQRPKEVGQMGLFDQCDDAIISKSVHAYQKLLREDILSGALTNTKQVFIHYVTHGFLNKHARVVLNDLKMEGVIDRVPAISYDSGYKYAVSLGVKK